MKRALLVVALFPSTLWAQTPPDVAGVWHTKHAFDISRALPPELKGGFAPLRRLDQAIVEQLNLPPRDRWVQPIVATLVRKSVPEWAQTIIRIGDDIGAILATLRSEGAMRLQKGVDTPTVSGSEEWTRLVFYWRGLCGDKIGGDPDLPPDCARFDIATSDNDNPLEPAQPRVRVGPIAAVLRPIDQQGHWQLAVSERRVELKIGTLLLAVIDTLVGKTTPWRSFEDATDCRSPSCIVDCPALGASVESLAPGFGPRTEAACVVAVRRAGRETMRILARGWADAAVLRFEGAATVSDGMLGVPEFDRMLRKDPAHRDGSWTGSFFSKTLKNMPGAWNATRSPVSESLPKRFAARTPARSATEASRSRPTTACTRRRLGLR